MFTRSTHVVLSASLLISSVPAAVEAAPSRKGPDLPVTTIDPTRANDELQAAEAAIQAGQFDVALAALNRAVDLAPNLDTIYLRRSGVLERLAGPEASWAHLQAASPSPYYQAVAQRLFYAATDAELYLRLASADALNRQRVEARLADLRRRQRRAEELAAAANPASIVVAPTQTPPPPQPPPPPPVEVVPATDVDRFAVEVDSVPVDVREPAPTTSPRPEAPSPPPPIDVPPTTRCDSPARPGVGMRLGGALLTSFGIGLMGAAATALILGRRAEDEYESALDLDARDRADARGRAMNRLAIAGAVSSVALLGGGVTLLVIDASRRHKQLRVSAAVAPSTWGLVLSGRF